MRTIRRLLARHPCLLFGLLSFLALSAPRFLSEPVRSALKPVLDVLIIPAYLTMLLAMILTYPLRLVFEYGMMSGVVGLLTFCLTFAPYALVDAGIRAFSAWRETNRATSAPRPVS